MAIRTFVYLSIVLVPPFSLSLSLLSFLFLLPSLFFSRSNRNRDNYGYSLRGINEMLFTVDPGDFNYSWPEICVRVRDPGPDRDSYEDFGLRFRRRDLFIRDYHRDLLISIMMSYWTVFYFRVYACQVFWVALMRLGTRNGWINHWIPYASNYYFVCCFMFCCSYFLFVFCILVESRRHLPDIE